jgi:hypothetical protein
MTLERCFVNGRGAGKARKIPSLLSFICFTQKNGKPC